MDAQCNFELHVPNATPFLLYPPVTLQELQKYEQFIFADHTNMIHVENVYEEILYQILLNETLKGKELAWAPGTLHIGERP